MDAAGLETTGAEHVWRRRFAAAVATALTIVVVVIALGAAAGRWRPVPVGTLGHGTHLSRSDVAVVVPVPLRRVGPGDDVLARTSHHGASGVYRVVAVDSWTGTPVVVDARGARVPAVVGSTVWRVSHAIPIAGLVYSWIVGLVQGVLLLLVAAFVVAQTALRRRRETTRVGAFAWWSTRLGVAVVTALGVLSCTAYATFVGNSNPSVAQGTITAGHLSMTLSSTAACSPNCTNALTTSISNVAPGDLAERPVDIQISSSNTSGILSKVQLTVTASSNTAGSSGSSYLDDATGLDFWIQKCSTPWSESGTSPATTYSCGGSTSDIIGSSLPAAPAAGTCPPASGTVSSIHSVETATDLNTSNFSITPNTHNYLVLFMCMPTTGSPDNYQGASVTLSFSFAGVQRSGSAH